MLGGDGALPTRTGWALGIGKPSRVLGREDVSVPWKMLLNSLLVDSKPKATARVMPLRLLALVFGRVLLPRLLRRPVGEPVRSRLLAVSR